MSKNAGALDGLRVVETGGLSAALAGRMLADMGAEVWKIEPPAGDPSRRYPPFGKRDAGRGPSFFFHYYNAGKRSLVADPASKEDGERLRRLILSADVWIDTTAPGETSPWRIEAEDLGTENPRLILARVTPFGLAGPFSRYRTTDLVAQAAGGMIFTNGHRGEAPLQGYGLQAYHSAAAYALAGILLALLERARSNRGQTVEVSVQEAVAGAVEETSAAWNGERRIEIRRGSMHWTRAFAVGRCRDGHILECTIGDWTTLHEWMKARGAGEDLTGEEWNDFYYRREHAERIFAALDRFVADQKAADVLAGAQLRRLPFAAVHPPEALRDDPQLAAREFFAPIDCGGGEPLLFPGPPFRMSKTPLRTRRGAPELRSSSWPAGRAAALPSRFEQNEARRADHRVLDGIRILDFTHVVAGPVATRILADHGAEVIKVERTVTLDLGDRQRGFFSNLNRGKKSVILNMADPRGVALAKRLAAKSDVVIDNFSARVMGNWQLDYEGLSKLRPDIIAVGMSGFGQTGPNRDYVSFGPTLHALAGYTSIMRHPGGEPAGWGYSYSDMCGGISGAIAVLTALHHRNQTGEGQFIDLSQLEAVAMIMGPMLLAIINDRISPEPIANRSQESPGAPHGVYRAAGEDRWVAIAVLSEDDWRRFAAAVAEPWVEDKRFRDAAARLGNLAALDTAVEAWTQIRSPEEITALLQSRGVPAYTVANGEDLCARDPHLQWRGYWRRIATASGSVAILDGVSTRLSDTPGYVAAPGPLHGEHTDSVLRNLLGLGDGELHALREEKVIA